MDDHRADEDRLPDDDLEERLARQSTRLDSVQKRRSAEKRKEPDGQMRGLGVGLTAAYGLILVAGMGLGLGWLIDYWLGTSFFIVIGVIAGLALGIAFAIHMSNRFAE